MSLVEVQSLESEITYALGKLNKKTGKTDPKQVEGYYLGFRTIEGGKYGPSKLHFFQTSKGIVGVWGKPDLDRKLSAVALGTMTKAEFAGLKNTPKGEMRTFKVYQDKDNTIEVDINHEAANMTLSDSGAYDGDVGEENEEEYESYDDNSGSIATAAVQISSADKAKRVQDLLKSKQVKK